MTFFYGRTSRFVHHIQATCTQVIILILDVVSLEQNGGKGLLLRKCMHTAYEVDAMKKAA